MKTRTGFWQYTVVGIVVSVLSTGIFRVIISPTWIHPNPAYQAYERADSANRRLVEENQRQIDAYRSRLQANRPLVDRRQFEEAIAGVRTLESVNDHNLRRVAGIMRPDTPSYIRVRYLNYMINEHNAFNQWAFSCTVATKTVDSICSPRSELGVLQQPARLQALLGGDTSVIQAPPIENSPQPRATQVQNLSAPPYSLPAPGWVNILAALIAAFTLSIGYTLAGVAVAGSINDTNSERLHPLNNLPPLSILAWTMWLVMLPGLLAIWTVRFLFTDLSPAISSLARYLPKRKKFRDEFERLEAMLVSLKGRVMDNSALSKQIDEMSERVRVAQTREQLAQLRNSLDGVRDQLEAIDEVEEFTKKR